MKAENIEAIPEGQRELLLNRAVSVDERFSRAEEDVGFEIEDSTLRGKEKVAEVRVKVQSADTMWGAFGVARKSNSNLEEYATRQSGSVYLIFTKDLVE